MDKTQAAAIADVLLKSASTQRSAPSSQELRRPWSRRELAVVLLSGFLGLVVASVVSRTAGVPWRGIPIIAELSTPFGTLVGLLVIAIHRVLTRRSSGRSYRSAA